MQVGKNISIRKQVIGENVLYFFIWGLVFIVPFMSMGMLSTKAVEMRELIVAWFKILPFYLLYLLNTYLLFRTLHRRRLYWAYYLVAALLIFFVFSMLELYERSDIGFAISLGSIGQSFEAEHISLSVFPWWGNMIAAALMFAANNGIRIFYMRMQSDEDEERLQRQNLQAEMYYLKHQINPHFLMNTLNNIHALVDIDSEAAKQAVIQLSDMMRYVVYDTGGDSISLKEEVRFIENYIELMRIRYTDDVKILFNKPEQLQGRNSIPPLIFIVFVENAFKHGVSYDQESYIYIDIKCEEGSVVGRFENSVNPHNSNAKHGIGLENVGKRLDLIYGEDYELNVENNENVYCITLKIPTLDNYEMHRNR